MTSETANAIADAFRELRDAFGVSIAFGATTITAIVAESELSRELVNGGFAATGEIQVKALLADLPSTPALGSAATYQAVAYKVDKRAIQPGGLIGEFTLRPAKR
jgi:hypothetical protein